MDRKVNLFHVGPQKSGTTWLYQALKEHYEVTTSETDAIHFFDMNFHRGIDWYHKFFNDASKTCVFDPTYTYIRDRSAPKKIFDYNSKAKIMFTARNPLERAFSHFWHEKKKDRFNFSFSEVFNNYDLFANWIEPGFYAMHYNKYLEFFPKEQIKILFLEDLNEDPKTFFEAICEFCEIDSSFSPSILEKKINSAASFKPREKILRDQKLMDIPFINLFVRAKNKLVVDHYIETLEDISPDLKNEIIDVFYDDVCSFEKITGRDLRKWREKYER